jgi:hypothetical protein
MGRPSIDPTAALAPQVCCRLIRNSLMSAPGPSGFVP